MKILAAAFAATLVAAPAFAQSGTPAPGGDAGKPAATTPEPAEAPAGTTPDKPADSAAATPEPEQAPEGTTPNKPADSPQG
jgi:hypothetical protein